MVLQYQPKQLVVGKRLGMPREAATLYVPFTQPVQRPTIGPPPRSLPLGQKVVSL